MDFLEELKQYFENHSKEEILEHWKKYDIPENNVGVTVNDFLDWNQKNNPNWKSIKNTTCPPQFGSCPYTHYCFMNNEKVKCTVCGNLVGGNNITC